MEELIKMAFKAGIHCGESSEHRYTSPDEADRLAEEYVKEQRENLVSWEAVPPS